MPEEAMPFMLSNTGRLILLIFGLIIIFLIIRAVTGPLFA